jgi:membrane protease YdiL (CAAX protease family)
VRNAQNLKYMLKISTLSQKTYGWILNLINLNNIPKNKTRFFFTLLGLNLITGIFGLIISLISTSAVGYDHNNFLTIQDLALRYLFFLIVAPITEELLFRSILSQKVGWIWVGTILICLVLISFLRFNPFYFYAFLGVWLILIFRQCSYTSQNFLIFTSAVFAGVHFGNYGLLAQGDDFLKVLLLPLVVIPQFFGGYFLGLIRIKLKSIWLCMLFHFCWNFTASVLLPLTLTIIVLVLKYTLGLN